MPSRAISTGAFDAAACCAGGGNAPHLRRGPQGEVMRRPFQRKRCRRAQPMRSSVEFSEVINFSCTPYRSPRLAWRLRPPRPWSRQAQGALVLPSAAFESVMSSSGAFEFPRIEKANEMDRTTLLKGLAGTGALAAASRFPLPALAQGADARTLRFVPQANFANFEPSAVVICGAQCRGARLGHALRRRRETDAAAPDGRERARLGGRPHLDLHLAPRAEIPRRRAGAGQGCGRQRRALVGARSRWA